LKSTQTTMRENLVEQGFVYTFDHFQSLKDLLKCIEYSDSIFE